MIKWVRLQRKRVSNLALWVYIVVGLLGFIPVAYFFDTDATFQVFDSLIIAALVGILVSYLAGAYDALKLPFKQIQIGQAYIVTLFLKGVGIVMVLAGLWYWRYYGKPDGLENSIFWLAGRYILALGAIALLAVNWTKAGVVEPDAVRRATALSAVAALTALLLIYYASR